MGRAALASLSQSCPTRVRLVTLHAIHRYRQTIAPIPESLVPRAIRGALAIPSRVLPGTLPGAVVVVGQSPGQPPLAALVQGGAVLTVAHPWRAGALARMTEVWRAWTPAEVQYVADHAAHQPVAAIARRLRRDPAAVVRAMDRHHGCSPTRQGWVTSGAAARGAAARLCGYSPQWLTAQARAGRLPAHRVPPGRWRRAPDRGWWLFDPASLPPKPRTDPNPTPTP